MNESQEKNWFDANEVASMGRAVDRCRLALSDIEPNRIALNVLRCYGAGETDEERIVETLLNRYQAMKETRQGAG
ncbi:MAG: hypothetical protein ACO27F_05005 [Beijerinckiaceae bacterium]|jgi:hypothetical protein